MARWTEPRWPGRCDSLRGFHIFRAAALRSSADGDSRLVRPRRLALGSPAHHGHAPGAVPGRHSLASAFPGARNLARIGIRVMAMVARARVRRRRPACRLAVLQRNRAERASASTNETDSAGLAENSVRISGDFLRDLSRA